MFLLNNNDESVILIVRFGDTMKLDYFILEDKVYCCKSVPNNMKNIIVYCHGFGENKEMIYQHAEILNSNNTGIISFDFPCHGDDKLDDSHFNLTNCILYLNIVIEYAKKYNVPIFLMGDSFGGYIILSRLNKVDEKFDRVFLKYPAVNFYGCTKRRLKIDLDYFNNRKYYQFLNGRKMYKESFIEFMNDDLMNSFYKHNCDIYILHGDEDTTVLLNDIKYFCNNNDIEYKVIKGARHGMKEYLDVVNEELLNYIK